MPRAATTPTTPASRSWRPPWEATGSHHGWSSGQSHPHLCEDCQDRAVEALAQAEADEREHQEQERPRLEAEKQAAAQKAGGWFSRFRT
ncbi:hypothetical protein ACFXAW_30070 [Streptomyces sp. NPDC059445]|uniref:hypothetical protein n=1 Tax=Streptomyces sp. NPDC059445 TaxID=3346832 RepID=UPI00369E5F29